MTKKSPKPCADDFNPQDYVRDLERGDVQFEPESLLKWLQTRRVFFYPAAGLEDWDSLNYFSCPAAGEMQCDLFVFCDWARQAADFEKTIRDREKLNRERPAGSHLKCSAIEVVKPEHLGTISIHANFDLLTEDEKAAYQATHGQFALREGWGRLAEIVMEDQSGIQCGSEPKYLATDRVHNWPWTQIVYQSQGLTVHKRPEPYDAVAGVKKVAGAEKRIQTWPFFVQKSE